MTADGNPIQMTVDDWEEKYRPRRVLPGTFDPVVEAPYGGCMYETYGEDLERVLEARHRDPYTVWTLVETDSGARICEGYHLVNRLGYFITAVPFKPEEQFEIADDFEDSE